MFRTNSLRVGRVTHRGFTLVELLVVVSIIALLMAILLPSLKKAREQAKSGVCLANLKSLGTSSHVYASDDRGENAVAVNETFVIADPEREGKFQRAVGRLCFGGKSGRGADGPAGQGAGNRNFWGTAMERGPGRRPLNRVIVKGGFADYTDNPGPGGKNWLADQQIDLGIFRCPSDTGWTGFNRDELKESRLSAYDHYGTSYSANVLYVYSEGAGDCSHERLRRRDCCHSNSPALRPLSRVPNPANTLLYIEECGQRAWAVQPEDPNAIGDCAPPSTITEVVRGWHGRDWFFNAAFTDSHAETIKMRGYRSVRLTEYPPQQNVPNDPEALYRYYCRIIVRGDKWQKDTLPGPLVPTNVTCDDHP